MDSLIWLGLFLIFEFDFFLNFDSRVWMFSVLKARMILLNTRVCSSQELVNYNYLMMEVLKKNSIVAPQKWSSRWGLYYHKSVQPLSLLEIPEKTLTKNMNKYILSVIGIPILYSVSNRLQQNLYAPCLYSV